MLISPQRIAALIIMVPLMAMVSNSTYGQEEQKKEYPVDQTTRLLTYSEVVQEEGDKNELFNRCVDFLNNFYKNPVAVSKVRDPETGIIKGQHQFRIYYTDEEGYKKDAGMIMYDFKVEFKEERYKFTVTDFLLRQASRYPVEKWLDKEDPEYNEMWDQYLKQIDAYMNEQWIPELKKRMKPVEIIEEEEW